MSTDLAPTIDPAIVERVLLAGDLRQLTPKQKVAYYARVCESVGLNPLTQPFAYLVLNGREVLYARREATDQLRRLHHVSVQIVAREVVEGCYAVTARATLPDGRADESLGAVPIDGLKGEARANALMKSETKAKRRATLSICGLGMLDESEIENLPPVAVDPPADPHAWGDRPPVVTETLRQARAHTPAPPAAPGVDPPPPLQTVKVIALEPAGAKSKAKGYLRHSGSPDAVAYYSSTVEQAAKDALAAGVEVVLEIALTKESRIPYIKAIAEAPPEIPF